MNEVETAAAPSFRTAQRIGFRRHLRAEVVAGEAAYLFSERGVTALAGAHVEAVAPLLDGTRDLTAVLEELPAGVTADQLRDLVTRLTLAGLVTGRDRPAGGTEEPVLAYWDAAGLNSATAATRVAGAQVRLLTVGGIDGDATAAALAGAGLTVLGGPTAPGADLSVVLCADYLADELAGIDAAHRADGRPWLLAKPEGAMAWVGPVFEPGAESGCWHCLAVRLAGNRQAERYVQTALGRTGPVRRAVTAAPGLTAAAPHLIAMEAVKWLAGYRYPGQRGVWTFDSLDLAGRHHELRGRPQCAACGDPALVRAGARRPIALQSRPKACYGTGGHRSQVPEQVLERYRHLVSPVTGVVKELERDVRGPSFFTTYRSGANPAGSAGSLQGLRAALRVENGGKGTTAVQAEVGALCEALERYSAVYQGDEERVRASLRSLGDQAVHPDRCQLFHPRQFADRRSWNREHSPFQHVCAPFDEDEAVDWTPLWSLTRQRSVLLPTGLLYFGAPARPGPLRTRADSNGNAAGSSLEDAVLQGLLEVVERDAVALWWYNRTRAPGVDLDAVGDPWTDELRAVYAGLGREVWVLDVTADLGIPTMVALSRSTTGDREQIMLGFGAHLDPAVALRRALSELNQLVPALLRSRPRDWADDPDAARWFAEATVADQPYLLPDPAVRGRRTADFDYTPRSDLAEDVRDVTDRIAAAGHEVLVLDQTRPDIGLPVVKVVVPGLRHFWARYAPGRLYDVPVRLGRLARPTPYEQLNPIPLFL